MFIVTQVKHVYICALGHGGTIAANRNQCGSELQTDH
jgi:hypothetical protein